MKEFKWGIVRNPHFKQLVKSTDRYVLQEYVVLENSLVAFAPKARQVALNLTHEEAEALCTILNAGGTSV